MPVERPLRSYLKSTSVHMSDMGRWVTFAGASREVAYPKMRLADERTNLTKDRLAHVELWRRQQAACSPLGPGESLRSVNLIQAGLETWRRLAALVLCRVAIGRPRGAADSFMKGIQQRKCCARCKAFVSPCCS